MNSIVIVKDVYLEHLMIWYYTAISECSGDGAAVICCGNPKETADFFIEWWKKNILPSINKNGYVRDEFFHPRDEYFADGALIINYHDGNESFMFCNKRIDLHFGDISFVVEEDCKTGWSGDFICEKVKE